MLRHQHQQQQQQHAMLYATIHLSCIMACRSSKQCDTAELWITVSSVPSQNCEYVYIAQMCPGLAVQYVLLLLRASRGMGAQFTSPRCGAGHVTV